MGSSCSRPTRVHALRPPADEPGSPWVMYTEDSSEIVYYYNFRTGDYTYEEKVCDWHLVVMENLSWWHNVRTGETRWDPPGAPTPLEPSLDAIVRYVANATQAPLVNATDLPVAAVVA